MKLALVTLSVLLLVTWTAVAKDINISRLTRLICIVHDETLIKNSSCKVRPISRDKSVANLSGFLTRQLHQIQAHITLYKKSNTVFKPFLVNVHENFCQLFTRRYGAVYLRLLISIVANYTNINHTCPYEGYIFVRNVPMDVSKLKSIWPAGEYRLDLNVWVNNGVKPVANVQVYLEMKEESFG